MEVEEKIKEVVAKKPNGIESKNKKYKQCEKQRQIKVGKRVKDSALQKQVLE